MKYIEAKHIRGFLEEQVRGLLVFYKEFSFQKICYRFDYYVQDHKLQGLGLYLSDGKFKYDRCIKLYCSLKYYLEELFYETDTTITDGDTIPKTVRFELNPFNLSEWNSIMDKIYDNKQGEIMTKELRPCPFCGYNKLLLNIMENKSKLGIFTTASISCVLCEAKVSFHFDLDVDKETIKKATIKAWNRRSHQEVNS